MATLRTRVVPGATSAISFGGILKKGLDIVTDIIPGPIDDLAAGVLVDAFSGGGSEPAGPMQSVPGTFASGGPCPGIGSVRLPNGQCVNLGDLGPGGAPAITPQRGTSVVPLSSFNPVFARYGVAVAPQQEMRTVRVCPPGWVLGDDGMCYATLAKTRRMYNPGSRPLLTGGEMASINKAEKAATRLLGAKKKLRKVEKAFAKC